MKKFYIVFHSCYNDHLASNIVLPSRLTEVNLINYII